MDVLYFYLAVIVYCYSKMTSQKSLKIPILKNLSLLLFNVNSLEVKRSESSANKNSIKIVSNPMSRSYMCLKATFE